ncbi:MAG: YceI family protein [Antricoccus sp.]
MTTASSLNIPTGDWKIDPVHSTVGFTVRHMMVSKVKGTFTAFEGTIGVAENIEDSKVAVSIDASSITTANEQRDGHLRSADFFNVENHAKITFTSTSITANNSDWFVQGDLSINGVTKPAQLAVEFGGVAAGQAGPTAGFEVATEITRSEFDITFNIPLEGGGVVIGDKIAIAIDVEANHIA